VHTETNAEAGNAIVVYDRAGDGRIRAAGSVATGGLGTGSGLGSQGALALAGDFLFAVDVGSDEVSVLDVAGPRPRLIERTPSGGLKPISVTVHDDLLYVLNAGGAGNITGFRVGGDATLTRLSHSTRRLAGQNPAQVGFSPDGSTLLVTEKGSDTLDTYAVGRDGRAGQPVSNQSSGATPFGFGFDPRARDHVRGRRGPRLVRSQAEAAPALR
jgi:6-phosphogluconolactonase